MHVEAGVGETDEPFVEPFLVGTALSLSLSSMFLHLEASRRALFGGSAGAALSSRATTEP